MTPSVTESRYKKILDLARRAFVLAEQAGIENLFQPGIIKEMIIADLLGHVLIPSKRDSDARSAVEPAKKYEYLSCLEGGRGQIDRMFKSPLEKRQKSLERITRNHRLYLAVFYQNDKMQVKIIYEIHPEKAEEEAIRQLDLSRNDISHVSFSERWAQDNGKIVLEGQRRQ